MGDIVVWMQSSLDGRTHGPHGEFDWPVVEEELNTFFVEELRSAAMFLYGRTVYDMMAGFWPTADEDPAGRANQIAYAKIWKPMPKLVFSTTLTDPAWSTTVLDAVDERVVRYRDAAEGTLYLFGGSRTVGEFARRDLVDEYQIFVHPVTLGAGAPLFSAPDRQRFALVRSAVFDGAVVSLRYRRDRAHRRDGDPS
jgi:dihydrofolate reductase